MFVFKESEIDPPEQIPSQTFTNQNFSPHQVPIPQAIAYPTIANNLSSTNHQVPPLTIGNNGIEETIGQNDDTINQHKDVPAGINRVPPVRNNNGQAYYSNNFSNKPRQQPNQNRTAQRPSRNREN